MHKFPPCSQIQKDRSQGFRDHYLFIAQKQPAFSLTPFQKVREEIFFRKKIILRNSHRRPKEFRKFHLPLPTTVPEVFPNNKAWIFVTADTDRRQILPRRNLPRGLSLQNASQCPILILLRQRTSKEDQCGHSSLLPHHSAIYHFVSDSPSENKLWRNNQDVPKTIRGHPGKDLQLI